LKALSTIFASFLLTGSATPQGSSDLDAVASSAYPASEPGAAVLVTKDGAVLLRKGYGLADLEQGIPIQPDMVFRIGSVTKQFTAAAILLLEQEGKLSVEDDLRKHLPDYPTSGRVITIEHLLTHTSGIRSYTDMEDFGEHAREDMGVDEVIALFENEPLGFEPGEKYAYNNSGYFLLGAIVEKVSGKTYEAFLREKIFEPLGMSQTYYGSTSRIIPKRAQGYDGVNAEFQNAEYLSMTLPYAAGSLLSTVDDLAKWDRALYGSELLSRESLEKWWKPFALASGASTYYGYGWSISSYQNRTVVSHGGGINGFTCHLLRIPEDRVFVAVLTNRNDEKSNPALVARKLAATAIGKPVEEPSATAAPGSLAKLAGLYRTSGGARHMVTGKADGLVLRRYGDEHPEGGRTRDPGPNERLNRTAGKLLPFSESEFLVEDSLTRVKFEGANELVVEDWGRVERAERIDEPFDDESRVLAAVRQLFEGVTARDGEAMWAVLDRDARLVRTETRNGRPRTRPLSAADFVTRILEHQGPPLREKIWNPEVRLSDNLATVWVPYAFYTGDRLTHCGDDAIQLAKTDIGWPGWKIIAMADTQRTEGCNPE
jgi:CubicO group peptidase (beta-lactamase class C family)